MAQPESKLSREIMRALRLRGYFCFKVHGNEHMMAGLPDIVVCAKGQFIGIESKMPDKRHNTSARQKHVHGEIKAAGGTVFVACSVDEALELVARVTGKS